VALKMRPEGGGRLWGGEFECAFMRGGVFWRIFEEVS
jgi:hypothetical protein